MSETTVNTDTQYTYYYNIEIDCDKKDVCCDYNSILCSTCKHNKAKKKSYYEPDYIPYYPYPTIKPYIIKWDEPITIWNSQDY